MSEQTLCPICGDRFGAQPSHTERLPSSGWPSQWHTVRLHDACIVNASPDDVQRIRDHIERLRSVRA